MQNAAFAALGLDWAYVPLRRPPERLEDAVRGLAALGFAGANVTIPHKHAVVELCDEAEGVGESVNTLVVPRRPRARLEHGRARDRGRDRGAQRVVLVGARRRGDGAAAAALRRRGARRSRASGDVAAGRRRATTSSSTRRR